MNNDVDKSLEAEGGLAKDGETLGCRGFGGVFLHSLELSIHNSTKTGEVLMVNIKNLLKYLYSSNLLVLPREIEKKK